MKLLISILLILALSLACFAEEPARPVQPQPAAAKEAQPIAISAEASKILSGGSMAEEIARLTTENARLREALTTLQIKNFKDAIKGQNGVSYKEFDLYDVVQNPQDGNWYQVLLPSKPAQSQAPQMK